MSNLNTEQAIAMAQQEMEYRVMLFNKYVCGGMHACARIQPMCMRMR